MKFDWLHRWENDWMTDRRGWGWGVVAKFRFAAAGNVLVGPGKLTIKLQIALSCSLFIYLYHFVHFLRVGRNETSIQLGRPKLLSSLSPPTPLYLCLALAVCVCAIGLVWVCDCLSFLACYPWLMFSIKFPYNFHDMMNYLRLGQDST